MGSKKVHMITLLTIVLFFDLTNAVFAQDFYKDYKKYLIINRAYLSSVKLKSRNRLIDSSIKRLQLTLNRFQKDNGHSFFTIDTVYLVSFTGAETGFPSEIIWNRKSSCYFAYSYEMNNYKVSNQKLDILTDASEILKSFSVDFRKAVEKFDTIAYLRYADKHRVFDGEWVSSMIAIKKGNHWTFRRLRGNGWAFDVDDSFNQPAKKQVNTSLTELVEKLTRDQLHFNIDSVKSAWLSDTTRKTQQPSFPVIVLQGKIIEFNKLKDVELSTIKSINVISGTKPEAAVFGESGKYGVIVIKTN